MGGVGVFVVCAGAVQQASSEPASFTPVPALLRVGAQRLVEYLRVFHPHERLCVAHARSPHPEDLPTAPTTHADAKRALQAMPAPSAPCTSQQAALAVCRAATRAGWDPHTHVVVFLALRGGDDDDVSGSGQASGAREASGAGGHGVLAPRVHVVVVGERAVLEHQPGQLAWWRRLARDHRGTAHVVDVHMGKGAMLSAVDTLCRTCLPRTALEISFCGMQGTAWLHPDPALAPESALGTCAAFVTRRASVQRFVPVEQARAGFALLARHAVTAPLALAGASRPARAGGASRGGGGGGPKLLPLLLASLHGRQSVAVVALDGVFGGLLSARDGEWLELGVFVASDVLDPVVAAATAAPVASGRAVRGSGPGWDSAPSGFDVAPAAIHHRLQCVQVAVERLRLSAASGDTGGALRDLHFECDALRTLARQRWMPSLLHTLVGLLEENAGDISSPVTKHAVEALLDAVRGTPLNMPLRVPRK